MTRQPSLAGQRGDRDRLITALGPDAERGTIPGLRRQVLDVLAALPPGRAPAASRRRPGPARLAGAAPRRCGAPGRRGACWPRRTCSASPPPAGSTGYSRTLLAGSRAVAEQVLADAHPRSRSTTSSSSRT